MDIQEFKRKKVHQSSESSSSEEDDAFVDDEPSQITRVTIKNANDNSWQAGGCVIVQVNLPVGNAAEVKTGNSESEIKSESGKSQNMSNVSRPSIYQQPLEPIQRKMKPQRYMQKPQIQYFYPQKALNDYNKKTKYQQKHDNASQYENRSNQHGYNYNRTTQRSQYSQSSYGQYNRQGRQQAMNQKQYGQNYRQPQQHYGSEYQSQHNRNYQQHQPYQDQSQYSEYETIQREQYKAKVEDKLSTTSSSDRKAQESQKKKQDFNFQKKKTDRVDKMTKKKQQQDELSMSFQALKDKEQEQQQIQRQQRKKQQQRKKTEKIQKQQAKNQENKRKAQKTNKKSQDEVKPAKSKEKVQQKSLKNEKVQQKPVKQQNKKISKDPSTQKHQLSLSNASNQTSNQLNNAKENITLSKIHSKESKPPKNPKDESSLWENSSQQDQKQQNKPQPRNRSLQYEYHQISLDFPLPPPMQFYDNQDSSMIQDGIELLKQLNPTAIIKPKQSHKNDELNSDKGSVEGSYRAEKVESKSNDSQQFDRDQLKILENLFGTMEQKKQMTNFIQLRIKTANVAWYKVKGISSKIFALGQVQLDIFKTNGIISVNQSQKNIPRDPMPFGGSKMVEEKIQYKQSKLILCSFMNPIQILNHKELSPVLNAKIKSLKRSFSNVHELLSIEQITLRCGVCNRKKNFFWTGAPVVHGCDSKCANILRFQITDMYVV